ncbi:hypothetical protein [Rhizobium sp. SL42]|uniref:hypothetical protein n=1 Tax=Rhizobium sp. SL42 TaxID=2806346 RepID=UPI001F393046|nr:hypothetical protein [Rhizobium sp. SL42]UJW77188.1 hypothetical protein IM739_22225 [Rhizobium sp. SL42]
MRSPWRFLADLASRQPRDKAPVEAPEAAPAVALADVPEDKLQDDVDEPAADQVEDALAVPSLETLPDTIDQQVSSDDEDEPSIAVSTADDLSKAAGIAPASEVSRPGRRKSGTANAGTRRSPARDVVAQPVAKDAAPSSVETEVSPAASAKLKGRSRVKPGSAAHVGNADANTPASAIQPASSRDPVIVEMESLDEDVRKLKRLLAEKLKMQNAHLTRLLSRFDRP